MVGIVVVVVGIVGVLVVGARGDGGDGVAVSFFFLFSSSFLILYPF